MWRMFSIAEQFIAKSAGMEFDNSYINAYDPLWMFQIT